MFSPIKMSMFLLLFEEQSAKTKFPRDPLASSSIPKPQAGIWKVEGSVLSCENNIKISHVCEYGNHNRHGLGYTITPKVPKNKSSKHYQRYILDHRKKC